MPAHKTNHRSEDPMPAHKTNHHAEDQMPAHKTSHAVHTNPSVTTTEIAATTTSPAPSAPPPAATASPTPGATGSSPPASAGASTRAAFIAPPPGDANIPKVPSNFIPQSGTTYRGITPTKAELVALPLAVVTLGKVEATYDKILGSTAPPYDELLQMFTVSNDWSSMRTSSSAWDAYCRDQEGICWTNMRQAMERLRRALALAIKTNPSVGASYAGLAALLGIKTGIARKGAATKRLNKAAIAKGEAPTHGLVGKRRKKAAAKVTGAPAAPTPTTSSVPANAATPVAAPAQSVPTAAASTAPVTATPVAAAPVANGASSVNGAGH